MKYVKLGNTDVSVSVLAMGCWALGGGAVWGRQDEADSLATVHAALDMGVNFFDTAEGYDDSEEVLGRALAGRRHQAVIATKVSRANLSDEEIRKACESSLRRLKTDVIDLYQIHWPSRVVPLAETAEALERLRADGKIRAAGVSNFGVRDLADLPAPHLPSGRFEEGAGLFVTDQLPYSLLWRAIEYEIRDKCRAAGVGILAYSPLAEGLLTGKYASAEDVPAGRARTRHFSSHRPGVRHGEPGCEEETFAAVERIRRVGERAGEPMARLALAWVLAQPGITAVIAGARRPEQIRHNARAVDLELSAEVIGELDAATEALKRKLGPNPDMWQSQSRFR
jgi:aryl-alcohol dehydrogenase-like predicted oxidoreductase